jgi:hypothetical protein
MRISARGDTPSDKSSVHNVELRMTMTGPIFALSSTTTLVYLRMTMTSPIFAFSNTIRVVPLTASLLVSIVPVLVYDYWK